MKRYVFSLILITNCFIVISATNPLNELFVGREWEFLEDQFIVKPNIAMATLGQQFKKWIPAIGAGIATGYATDYVAKQYIPEKTRNFELQSFIRFFGDPSVGLLTVYSIYKLIKFNIQSSLDHRTLIDFVRLWPDNKQFTPEQFHTTFEALHKQYIRYDNNNQFDQKSAEITRLVKSAIYRHFPEKYEYQLKDADAPFYQHTFLHTIIKLDIGDLIRTIAHIFSAFNSHK